MAVKKDLATLVGHLEELNHDAQGIKYDNTVSALTATDVQSAIDELKTLIGGGGYTDEQAQDAAAALIQNGTGISWSYNDIANTLTPTVTLAPFSTTNLAEGSNLYYTDERVDDRVAALLVAGAGISLVYSDVGNTLTIASTITQYTDELAQDAVFGAMVDSSSIDFQYNDAGNSWTAVVLPAGVDHNLLANVSVGDVHTQYMLAAGTVTNNAIAKYSGTGGRQTANSGVIIDGSNNMTGILTAVIGTGTTLTLGSGTAQSSGDFTISSASATGNIKINPGASGNITSTSIQNEAVLFANTSGGNVYIDDDNTAFVYNRSNITMAIGWPQFTYTLDGSTKGSRLILFRDNLGSINASYANIQADNTAGVGPTIDFLRSRGSLTTPTAITAADQVLGMFRGCGFDGTDFARSASIEFRSVEAFSSTASGGKIVFTTCKAGGTSLSDVITITDTGTLSFLNSGASITNASAGPDATGSGFTQWNVDNLRLDGNTLSSTNTNGNLILDPNGTGVIQLSANSEIAANTLFFGASNEASIAYSTNLNINPDVSGSGGGGVYIGDGTTPRRIKAEALTLGDNSSGYSAVRAININQTSSTFSNGMFCSMDFSGSTVTARAMNMTMTHSGGSASTASVVNVFTATHTVEPTGTVTMQGTRGQASAGVASSTGTKLYHGLAGAPGISTGHTGGTIRSIGVYAILTTGSAGSASWTDWGMLTEGDFQINSDKKFILEGSTTTKGDTYGVFNSATTDVDWFVDNTKVWNWDNDYNESMVPLLFPFKRTTVADAAYTVLNTDQVVEYTSLTAARTVTLPSASSHTTKFLIIKDGAGTAGTNTITINRAGSDTIDGGTSVTITANYGVIRLYSNGSNGWLSW